MFKYSWAFLSIVIILFSCKTKTPVLEKKGFIPIDNSSVFEEVNREEISFQPQIFKNATNNHDVTIIQNLQNTSFHFYNGIAFESEEKGVLVGGAGLRIRSTLNGGKTWSQIRLSRFADSFHSVAFAKNNAFVVGEGSFIVKSDSSLRNWSVFDLKGMEGLKGDSHKLYKIKFLDQLGFAMGFDTGFGISNPLILKTLNYGKNWTVVTHKGLEDEIGAINDFEIISENLVYIVTQMGNTYKSNDSGSTWTKVFAPRQEYTNLNSIAFKDDKTGFISGTSGLLYFTNDGGKNWTQNTIMKDSTDLNISDIKYLSDDTIAITTSESFVDEERPSFTYLLDGNGGDKIKPLLTKRDTTVFFEGDAFSLFLLKDKHLFIVDRNNVYSLDAKDISTD
jgi:photosystem II stability/assembly factor-like uncharacterized protein